MEKGRNNNYVNERKFRAHVDHKEREREIDDLIELENGTFITVIVSFRSIDCS